MWFSVQTLQPKKALNNPVAPASVLGKELPRPQISVLVVDKAADMALSAGVLAQHLKIIPYRKPEQGHEAT